MARVFFIIGSVAGMLGVICGAFGAHGLEDRLDAEMLAIWNTAATYQMYHAVALLGAAWACERFAGRAAVVAGWLLTAGIVVFSGSLYVLALTGVKWLGAITPLGGLAFIVGWAMLIVAAATGNDRGGRDPGAT